MLKETVRKLETDSGSIEYTLTRKKVKNVNLRVKEDGRLLVSANSRVPVNFIDNFVKTKSEWITQAKKRALERQSKKEAPCNRTDEECIAVFTAISDKIYPTFEKMLGQKPFIKVKLMKSRWGVCYPLKRVIILNNRLLDMPMAAVEYVVLHEYVHFIHKNHQAGFHSEMAKLMPDYKERSKLLKG